ncbi:MAG: hypothetical protein JRN10_00255 [Nitrososphaerota archaeon]|jgi:hypothetical protein|nr:hypothetical protein [Nitrososphaerota archaeon]MDG6929669.1 hypothetical protein [Nitrososphaerota archaeon]
MSAEKKSGGLAGSPGSNGVPEKKEQELKEDTSEFLQLKSPTILKAGEFEVELNGQFFKIKRDGATVSDEMQLKDGKITEYDLGRLVSIFGEQVARNIELALLNSQKPVPAPKLRESITLSHIEELMAKIVPNIEGDEVRPSSRIFRIFLAYEDPHYPPRILIDKDGWVNQTRLSYSFTAVTDRELISQILDHLRLTYPKRLSKILKAWGLQPEFKNGRESPIPDEEVAEAKIIVQPVPQLADPSILNGMDWPVFVNQLVSFKVEKDPRLALVHKTHLLRGLDILINPHGLEVTNGGTGKSSFYDVFGINPGKVTAPSFLGFAKSPQEIFPGVINESELPIGIDQIESQSAFQIFRFMFNALEYGHDVVLSGAAKFTVETTSIFSLLANTYSNSSSYEKSFASLLEHISINSAIGRRFAIIVYGNNYKRIITKPSPDILREWHEAAALFRAVEEFDRKELLKILHSPQVWNGLNTPIESYEVAVNDISSSIQDETVKGFLEEHAAGAQVRIKGAAIYAALADSLANIALGKFVVDELLERAEDYLTKLIQINVESIMTLAQEYKKEISTQRIMLFSNLPDYLKEIVSAIELWRRSNPENKTVLLTTLRYRPKNENYKTIHECLRKLNARKNVENILEELKRAFEFDLIKRDSDWECTLLTKTPRFEEIEPLGTMEVGLD